MRGHFFDCNDGALVLEICWRATFSLSARYKIGKLIATAAIHWRGQIFAKHCFIMCLRALMRPDAAVIKPCLIIAPIG